MISLNSVCVFCGSRKGFNTLHQESAQQLGRAIAQAGIRLVYGGGGIGLMNVVAQAALDAKGDVTGVIPEYLARSEKALESLTDLLVVDSLHERKRIMFERSDAFVALPGGIGTLDEIVELLLWRQVGLHDKPIILVNEDNFWDPLETLLKQLTKDGFAAALTSHHYIVVETVDDVLPALRAAPDPTIKPRLEQL